MLPHLTRCFRDDLDCVDICSTTARVLTRNGDDPTATSAQVQAREASKRCADSCGGHRDMHEHCRFCEQACREVDELRGQLASTQ